MLLIIFAFVWFEHLNPESDFTFGELHMNGYPYARLNTFHGPKRQILGNQAGYAAPAWRMNVVPPLPGQGIAGNSRDVELGSKIFLSRLPVDVGEKEVEVGMKVTCQISVCSHSC
jgi:hypothetical protein